MTQADARSMTPPFAPQAQEILESIGDAFYALDRDWRFLYLNGRAEELWGKQRNQLLGRSIWEMFPHAVGSAAYEEHLRAAREFRHVEIEMISPIIGRWIELSIYPSSFGLSVYFRDVHERKLQEERTQTLLDDLRAATAAKDAFFTYVSHELKTPITMILGNADILMRRGDALDPQLRDEARADVYREAQRLSRVLDGLLALAHAERGQAPEPEPIVLERVVRHAIDEFRLERPQREVRFDAGEELIALGVRTYVEQVVQNLLSNADKYSPAHEPIDVVLERARDEAHMRVCDRGPGIDGTDIERIFAPFYRSPDATFTADGMGVGLAVSRRLVEAQGGRLWFAPRARRGSEFCHALRLAPDGDADG
jgi:PAS domain S-box-containing protein